MLFLADMFQINRKKNTNDIALLSSLHNSFKHFSSELCCLLLTNLIKFQIHFAFSRDQEEKVYVSHLLEKNADELWRVIGENSGHLYVCG